MSDLVTVTIHGHIADVRLNRPEKYNALNLELMDALAATAESLSNDSNLRAVVLSGEGKAFCAGIDLSCFDLSEEFLAPFKQGSKIYPNRYQRPAMCWRQLPIPVICAIEGVAFGGGLQLALGADIRIAHPKSKLSLMEAKWGLIPDMGGSQLLRHLVRQDAAKELAFTGRIVEASEALSLGLVTQVDDNPREKALNMAESIAQSNPDAISADKFLIQEGWECTETQGLQLEEQLQSYIIGSANQIEAVKSQQANKGADFVSRKFESYKDLNSWLKK